MSESPQALLHIPVPDRATLSFCAASPWALQRWIAELPKANLGGCAQRLYLGLLEIVRLQTPAENRLQLLELLRPEIHFVCTHLEPHFLLVNRASEERAHKVANLCQALQRLLASGYEQLVVLEEPAVAEQEACRLRSATAVQRALYALNATLVRSKQLYSPAHEGLWREMHSLYRIARDRDLLRLPVPDGLLPGHAASTVQRTYTASLMLGTSRCNQLGAKDIARLARALESWSALVRLQAQADSCPLQVDLTRDGPPRYRRLCEPVTDGDLLGIDPAALLCVLDAWRHPDAASPDSLPPLPGGLGFELLDHLQQAWGDLAQRACPREPGQGRLGVVLGMQSLHYHLAGRQTFGELLRRQDDACRARFQPNRGDLEDVWNQAFDVGSLDRRKGPAAEAIPFRREVDGQAPLAGDIGVKRHPVFALPVVDRSQGGYGLFWPGLPASRLRVGELLGIQPASRQDWAVGVIRWIRQVADGARLGVELIAEHAEPCGLRLVDAAQPQDHYLRALQLPEGDDDAAPASLVTASLPFREDCTVQINRHGEEQLAVLRRRLASLGRFSRFEYRLFGYGGVEDFSSLWTLL